MELFLLGNLKHVRIITVTHFILTYLQCCQAVMEDKPYRMRGIKQQLLDDKPGSKFHKCVLRSCSYRNSYSAFWDCVSDHCISNSPTAKKRWIDTSYYYQARRSAETSAQMEKCIQINCKRIQAHDMQNCLKTCSDIFATHKRSFAKWVDPTVYGKRISQHAGFKNNELMKPRHTFVKGKETSNRFKRYYDPFETTGKRNYYPFTRLAKRNDPIASYDDTTSPKRWLDPMTYKKDRSKMISPISPDMVKRSTFDSTENEEPFTVCKTPFCELDLEGSLDQIPPYVQPIITCLYSCGSKNEFYGFDAEMISCLTECTKLE